MTSLQRTRIITIKAIISNLENLLTSVKTANEAQNILTALEQYRIELAFLQSQARK